MEYRREDHIKVDTEVGVMHSPSIESQRLYRNQQKLGVGWAENRVRLIDTFLSDSGI